MCLVLFIVLNTIYAVVIAIVRYTVMYIYIHVVIVIYN